MKFLIVFLLVACASTQLPPTSGNEDLLAQIEKLKETNTKLRAELVKAREEKNKWKENAKFHESLYWDFDELEDYHGVALECCTKTLNDNGLSMCVQEKQAYERAKYKYWDRLVGIK